MKSSDKRNAMRKRVVCNRFYRKVLKAVRPDAERDGWRLAEDGSRAAHRTGTRGSCQAAMGPPFTAARVRKACKAGSPDEACVVRRR